MALPALPTAENELGSVVDNVDVVDAAKFNAIRRLIESLALTKPRIIGDATNGIVIDPDNKRIEFRGTAQPTEELQLPFYADISGTGGGSFGGGFESTNFIYASSLVTGATRGIKTYGFTIPPWVDVTKSIEVVGMMQMTTSQLTRSIVWNVFADIARRGSGEFPLTSVIEPGAITTVTSLDGIGSVGMTPVSFGSFAADTFQTGDHVSLAVQRTGTHVSDTYSYTILLSRTVALKVKRRYV